MKSVKVTKFSYHVTITWSIISEKNYNFPRYKRPKGTRCKILFVNEIHNLKTDLRRLIGYHGISEIEHQYTAIKFSLRISLLNKDLNLHRPLRTNAWYWIARVTLGFVFKIFDRLMTWFEYSMKKSEINMFEYAQNIWISMFISNPRWNIFSYLNTFS